MGTQTTYRVLLVDDNPNDLELMQLAIEEQSLPIRVIPFFSPLKALAYLRAGNTVHLVLSDLNMGEMNGVEFLSTILADPALASLPVALTSSSKAIHIPARLTGKVQVPYFEKGTTWDDFRRLARLLHVALSEPAGGDASHAGHTISQRMSTPLEFEAMREREPTPPAMPQPPA